MPTSSRRTTLTSSSSSLPCFKSIYLDLIQHKMLWFENEYDVKLEHKNDHNVVDNHHHHDKKDANLEKGNEFNVHVSVRFKPLTPNKHQSKYNRSRRTVTLPLHQKLALIKHQNNIVNNADALSILKQEGEWFKDKWSALEKGNIDLNDINSLQEDESKKDKPTLSCGIQSIDNIDNSVVVVDPTKGLRIFQYDQVFLDDCKQDEVYKSSAQPLVQDFLNGVNACCLVYGVTGSGKTYTMFGPNDVNRLNTFASLNGMNNGIVPIACKEIFDALTYRKNHVNLNIVSQVSISYVEIFGNEISDLLRCGRLCCPNKAASQRFVLSGAAEYIVNSVEDVTEALKKGEKQKRKAATALNDRSSRAHSIVIISLNQHCQETGVSRSSELFLADLGGCEKTKKSQINSGVSMHFENADLEEGKDHKSHRRFSATGFVKSDRMREAVYINLGLMALKACVEALILNSRHIPYSDSKLTMMLSDALGGNSKTSVIVCACQDETAIKETVAALRFGESCRHISNSLQTETNFLRQLLDKIDNQIMSCQETIKRKERWVTEEVKREDTFAEEDTLESKGFGGFETRKTTVLVGAEKEHRLLNDLLRQRAEITGSKLEHRIEEDQRFGGEIGFGIAHRYGLGKKYDDEKQSDYRFGDVDKNQVPAAIHQGWTVGEVDFNEDDMMQIRDIKSKSKLVYSGLSF